MNAAFFDITSSSNLFKAHVESKNNQNTPINSCWEEPSTLHFGEDKKNKD